MKFFIILSLILFQALALGKRKRDNIATVVGDVERLHYCSESAKALSKVRTISVSAGSLRPSLADQIHNIKLPPPRDIIPKLSSSQCDRKIDNKPGLKDAISLMQAPVLGACFGEYDKIVCKGVASDLYAKTGLSNPKVRDSIYSTCVETLSAKRVHFRECMDQWGI